MNLHFSLLLTVIAMIGTIAAGVLALLWVKRWSKQAFGLNKSENDLGHFRDLYQQGALSKTEYDRIRKSLIAQHEEKTDRSAQDALE